MSVNNQLALRPSYWASVSGGKDSLCLLYALHGLKRFYPKKFDIIAITVDLWYNENNIERIPEKRYIYDCHRCNQQV